MKIGVVGNCIASGVGMGIQQLRGDVEVMVFFSANLLDPQKMKRAADKLACCDLVFMHPLNDRWGIVSAKVVQETHKHVFIMPVTVFTGFHPDCIGISLDGTQLRGPLGTYHSGVSAAAFALGLTVNDTLRLFNANVFEALGYFSEFTKARVFLNRSIEKVGLDPTGEWPNWMARAPFMHTFNHPKASLVAGIAKLLAVKSELIPERSVVLELAVDELSTDTQWPVYPELATAIGIQGGYLFKRPGRVDLTGGASFFLTLRGVIEGSFTAYRDYPPEAFSVPSVRRIREVLQSLI